jgi:glycosyltransferase involved in cell wall biosynthesis
VIAPTHAVLESLNHEFGVCGGSVIHNGRDRDWVNERPKEPLILSAGRVWDEAKNVAALESVAPMLDWPVFVAGDNEVSGVATAPHLAIRRLGLLPFRDLAGWLSRAAIYAAPARYEPFGLAALEAALCKCALVLGDIPSLREVWDDAALFVTPDDHGALRTTLQQLVEQPALCREMGARACARAERYDADSMAESYVTVYRSLLSIGAAAP